MLARVFGAGQYRWAAAEGETERMCSVWHLWIMRVMYRAMCSLSVNTLPWPMGPLGPRKADREVNIKD